MANYDAGTLVRLTAVFTNSAGVVTDPGAVTCAVRKPDNTMTSPAVVKDSTGTYHADVDTTNGPQGDWSYRLSGTSPVQVVADGTFYVKVLGF